MIAGVTIPSEYVTDGVPNTDLVLLVTPRPTLGRNLAWAVACERDQWGRATAGHVNITPSSLPTRDNNGRWPPKSKRSSNFMLKRSPSLKLV